MTSTVTFPFIDSPEYKGNAVLALNVSLIAITTVTVCLRLNVWAFMSKTLGIDDGTAFTAYARPY